MTSWSILMRYLSTKVKYSVSLAEKTRGRGESLEVTAMRTLLNGKMTFLHRNKGEEMAPTIGTEGGTLLVRKILEADATKVHVGDMVMMRDPINSDKFLVRRLAATEGYEMESTDEDDEPFVLEKNECWVLADNEDYKPKDSYDSRTFGPVSMNDIVGRVIYCLRNDLDHGPVKNSKLSAEDDSAVLTMELDVDELKKTNQQ